MIVSLFLLVVRAPQVMRRVMVRPVMPMVRALLVARWVVVRLVMLTRSREGALATGRCGGHAQASRQAKHCAHKGILMLVSCDKAFQDPCHFEAREQKYVQQHIRICTPAVQT